jgi:hypothetical protein
MLRGLIAMSTGTSITTRYLTRHLGETVPPQLLGLIIERTGKIHLLQDEVALAAREVFGKAYKLQMYLSTRFAVAQLPSTAIMWTAQNYSRVDQDEYWRPQLNEGLEVPKYEAGTIFSNSSAKDLPFTVIKTALRTNIPIHYRN